MPPSLRTLAPIAILVSGLAVAREVTAQDDPAPPPRPNVILCMTDDQGWADAGFQGHEVLKTPQLDALAARGMVLTRFYAQSPVCSPTRASCLTGQHPVRLGIPGANSGHLPEDTPQLATMLRAAGYATGHFGKWHLGTLTREVVDSNRGGRKQHDAHHAPPWERGFDVCFSTEAKVPTADPMQTPGEPEKPYGTRYWRGPGEAVTDNLAGDDSRVIMDRVLPFVRDCADRQQPFFAVVWFHAPHLPLVATAANRAPYAELPQADYYGALAGVDQQMGRLAMTLDELGIATDTLLWFCSDNGPERDRGGSTHGPADDGTNTALGSAAPLRGRKRSLHEGGIRVPAFVVWPGEVPAGTRRDSTACTVDYLPTIAELLHLDLPDTSLDGVSLAGLIRGADWQRPRPLGFRAGPQSAWIDGDHKLIRRRADEPFELYDLETDPAESRDLADQDPERASRLREDLEAWLGSFGDPGSGRRP